MLKKLEQIRFFALYDPCNPLNDGADLGIFLSTGIIFRNFFLELIQILEYRWEIRNFVLFFLSCETFSDYFLNFGIFGTVWKRGKPVEPVENHGRNPF